MSEEPTRRAVLQAAAITGSLAVLGSTAARGDRPTVRLLEAGIRYDLPDRPDYDRVHVDSRPAYTVDEGAGQLTVSSSTPSGESGSLTAGTEDAPPTAALAQEHAAHLHGAHEGVPAETVRGPSRAIAGSGRRVSVLPTALTTRKRVRAGIRLAEAVELPNVTVRWNGATATVTVPSGESVDLSPGTTREIALETESVTVQTRTATEELASLPSAPDWQTSVRREEGTTTVDATPVVEFASRGELAVSQGHIT